MDHQKSRSRIRTPARALRCGWMPTYAEPVVERVCESAAGRAFSALSGAAAALTLYTDGVESAPWSMSEYR
jgi:hypothetical protein